MHEQNPENCEKLKKISEEKAGAEFFKIKFLAANM